LAGEGLGRGDADLDARKDRQSHVAFTGDGRCRHVHNADDFFDLALAEAEGCESVGGFARLADEKREAFGRKRRLAVAEFRGDIDFTGQARERFEPVFRGEAGIGGGAAGHQRQAVEMSEVERGGQVQRAVLEVMRQRIAKNGGLLGDFLGHEMLVAAFFDAGLVDVDAGNLAVGGAVGTVEDLRALAGDKGIIALFEIGDTVGHRGERDGVGAYKHFAVAIADGQRRAFAGGDDEVFFAVEEKAKRECPFEAAQSGFGRAAGVHALIHVVTGQHDDGFGIGFAFLHQSGPCQFFAQFTEVLDDAVVDDCNRAGAVGVGVADGSCAVCRPAGVTDAGLARERVVDQQVGEVHQFADGAATVETALMDGCDTCRVVAAIFKAFQRLDQQGGDFVVPKDTDNSAHFKPLSGAIPSAP
jgi:hypothetical protein